MNEEGTNMLLEAIKSLITEEQLNAAIKLAVAERFSYNVEMEIKKRAQAIAEEYCDKKLEVILDDIYGRSVCIDDGFGSRKSYQSFEDFVRNYTGEQLRKQYNIEYKVKQVLQDRIAEACKNVVKERAENLTDKVIEALAEGKK